MTRPVDDATTDFGDNCDEPRDCTNLSRATFGGAGAAEAGKVETDANAARALMRVTTDFRLFSTDSD